MCTMIEALATGKGKRDRDLAYVHVYTGYQKEATEDNVATFMVG